MESFHSLEGIEEKPSFFHLKQATKPIFLDIQRTFCKFDQIFFFTLPPIPLLSYVFTGFFSYHFPFELSLTQLLFAFNAFVHH